MMCNVCVIPRQLNDCFSNFDQTEIGDVADAVSLPGLEVLPHAEQPQAEISAGDEDERIPL